MPSRPNPIQGRARLDTFTKLPGGWLAYDERTVGYTWTTTLTTILSVTFPLPADRLLKVTLNTMLYMPTSGNNTGYGRLALVKELGGTVYKYQYVYNETPIYDYRMPLADIWIISRPADTLYTLTWDVDLTGGTIETMASANYPTQLLVEDLGPAP